MTVTAGTETPGELAAGFCAECGARLPNRPRKGPQARYCPRPRRCRQRAYERRHDIKPGRSRRRGTTPRG